MSIKGVVICGGLGTRLYPLTKTVNKQMLPVYDQPLVYYPLKTLINAGIEEIMIISAAGHAGQFLEHFSENREFEKIRFEYAVQKNPTGGIADALRYAERFAGTDKIAVILGDNIYEDNLEQAIKDFDQNQSKGARIFLKEVKDSQRFGCPEIDHSGTITKIIEKPKQPPTNYAVTGIYLYDNRIWNVIKSLVPSDRGQLEITEANNFYVYERSMTYENIKGEWIDAGTFPSLLKASIWAARQQGVDINDLND